jgi:uncharacterized protein YoxC
MMKLEQIVLIVVLAILIFVVFLFYKVERNYQQTVKNYQSFVEMVETTPKITTQQNYDTLNKKYSDLMLDYRTLDTAHTTAIADLDYAKKQLSDCEQKAKDKAAVEAVKE